MHPPTHSPVKESVYVVFLKKKMGNVKFDILAYIPFIFITTVLGGLKLDESGAPGKASWVLITILLIIYIPTVAICYVFRNIFAAPRDVTRDVSHMEDGENNYDRTHHRYCCASEQIAYSFIYSKESAEATASIILWLYVSLVPWVISF